MVPPSGSSNLKLYFCSNLSASSNACASSSDSESEPAPLSFLFLLYVNPDLPSSPPSPFPSSRHCSCNKKSRKNCSFLSSDFVSPKNSPNLVLASCELLVLSPSSRSSSSKSSPSKKPAAPFFTRNPSKSESESESESIASSDFFFDFLFFIFPEEIPAASLNAFFKSSCSST